MQDLSFDVAEYGPWETGKPFLSHSGTVTRRENLLTVRIVFPTLEDLQAKLGTDLSDMRP